MRLRKAAKRALSIITDRVYPDVATATNKAIDKCLRHDVGYGAGRDARDGIQWVICEVVDPDPVAETLRHQLGSRD